MGLMAFLSVLLKAFCLLLNLTGFLFMYLAGMVRKSASKGWIRLPVKTLDKVKTVYMLADAKKRPIDFKFSDGMLTIDLSTCRIPLGEVNKYAEVIVELIIGIIA